MCYRSVYANQGERDQSTLIAMVCEGNLVAAIEYACRAEPKAKHLLRATWSSLWSGPPIAELAFLGVSEGQHILLNREPVGDQRVIGR